MDVELRKRINEILERLQLMSIEGIDFNNMDPVAKMMLVALVNEVQKTQDYVDNTVQRVIEKFCSDFIPKEKIEAQPAIVLLNPKYRKKESELINVGSDAYFYYRSADSKFFLNYIPIFNTLLIPFSRTYLVSQNVLKIGAQTRVIRTDKPNSVWFGIETNVEINSLKGLPLFIKGTGGISPEHIYVGSENTELDFCTMRDMEKIEMVEPFDAQQASGEFFTFIRTWKRHLQNMPDASLIYITDVNHNRDIFKPRPYPKVFQQWLEDDALDSFNPNTLWLQFDFDENYHVPEECDISVNVLPVTNVDKNELTLTPASPIAKLQKQDDSFFLKILETSASANKQGFNMMGKDIIVRDFDAASYNNGSLYRDVRNLCNKFKDDYYAFVEYNGIKDGKALDDLRRIINRLGNSVGETNSKYKFDSGTYVMKDISQEPNSSMVKVYYITTQGNKGNTPVIGEEMENKRLPLIEYKTKIVMSAACGSDKATADERYELLRYYALTNDRLYTKMDIEAFLRKELLTEFGKTEFQRINVRINVEGTEGDKFLKRGLYIDIEFKDKKNYDSAIKRSFGIRMKLKIEDMSCIAMPIIVNLTNLEEM